MSKQEYKTAYSFFREVHRDFNERLQTSNWPCGYDDSMCEKFDHHQQEWLNKNPIVKEVVKQLDDSDYLADRAYNGSNRLKQSLLYRKESA